MAHSELEEDLGVQRVRSRRGGRRPDLGELYVRSSWEANWARYLNWLQSVGQVKDWVYEPETFEFPVKKGARFYTPDFRVVNMDGSTEYHEVKGWMTPASATKLKRMAKYHPHIKLIVIDAECYLAVEKAIGKRSIANWE